MQIKKQRLTTRTSKICVSYINARNTNFLQLLYTEYCDYCDCTVTLTSLIPFLLHANDNNLYQQS